MVTPKLRTILYVFWVLGYMDIDVWRALKVFEEGRQDPLGWTNGVKKGS